MVRARREVTVPWLVRAILVGFVWLSPLTLPLATRAAEAKVATATAAATPDAGNAEHLKQLLAGGTPTGVADLRAMQQRVYQLADQLTRCTVGVQVGAAQGSGVIISKDGYVLTAAHVAGTPNKDVLFLFPDGRTMTGKTLGLDRSMDAGLMKIKNAKDLPFAEMGVSDRLKVGQWCLAMGHPGGYQADRKPVLRLGRIVFLDNVAVTTDCTLVGGDSGGPLFNMEGKVIGINSRISSPLTANMHVPVDTFKTSWQRLVKADAWGHYPGQEPFIGIRGEANVKEAKVAHIFPESPAEKAGLKVGDVILALNGGNLPDFAALSAAIRDHQPGDTIELHVQRGEDTLDLKLKIGKRGDT
jgi:serine protease Do